MRLGVVRSASRIAYEVQVLLEESSEGEGAVPTTHPVSRRCAELRAEIL
jgi:hypothetical protein